MAKLEECPNCDSTDIRKTFHRSCKNKHYTGAKDPHNHFECNECDYDWIEPIHRDSKEGNAP